MHNSFIPIKELCIKLVIWKSLYYDAWSEKHQNRTGVLVFNCKNVILHLSEFVVLSFNFEIKTKDFLHMKEC